MWPEYIRNAIIVAIPFSIVFYGASFRKDASNKAKVAYGKNVQKVAIADAAFLILGDYMATGKGIMTDFYIGLALSIALTIIFFVISNKKKPR